MKLSLCNEVIRELPFAAQCEMAAGFGYAGLEIAPFTLCDDPRDLDQGRIGEIRTAVEAAGLEVSGLHWLLVAPQGLSITSPDPAVWRDTLEVMTTSVRLCAALGGSYLVHGSPVQRQLPDDAEAADAAAARAIEAFAAAAEAAEEAGVIYCIEPLAKAETNFINTVAEATDIVETINHPNLKTMIDCCAAGKGEDKPTADLIDEWLPGGKIAHIQVNDPNHRGPGQGDEKFAPILGALKRNGYQGWIAAEPFVYEPDGPTTAAVSAAYLKGILEALE